MHQAAELAGITKRFGEVVALAGADLTLRSGEVHGLLGQNGAGKTTLARILGGLTGPDSGRITIAGRPGPIRGVAHARSLGIGVVHQHFSMVPAFSGLDNVRLFHDGAWSAAGLPVDGYRASVLAKAEGLGLDVVLDEAVDGLSVGDRQRLELLKVLMTETNILILDEPTAVLTPREVESLFQVLRRLAGQGTAICLIAHKLNEVLEVADRVTVLRDGATVLTRDASRVTQDELVGAMMGGEGVGAGRAEPEKEPAAGDLADGIVAQLTAVSVGPPDAPVLSNVSLSVRRGEIVGVAGVEGNGQRALAAVLAGATTPDRGTASIPEGVGWIPQDRSREGLIGSFSLTENVALAFHRDRRYRRGLWFDWRAVEETTERIVAELSVRTDGPSSPAMTLSGGNQQKLLTGRELERAPDLLIAESPTRGLDVGAAATVQRRIRRLAKRPGAPGVVLISTDLDEILELSDRIVVLAGGRLIDLPPSARTRAEIGERMLSAGRT